MGAKRRGGSDPTVDLQRKRSLRSDSSPHDITPLNNLHIHYAYNLSHINLTSPKSVDMQIFARLLSVVLPFLIPLLGMWEPPFTVQMSV